MKTFFILASASPRRRQILKNAGFHFRVFPTNSSEHFDKNLTLSKALKEISRVKARACLDALTPKPNSLYFVLAADTVVVSENQILGKPKSSQDARRMLRLLSGKTHVVKTSFTLFRTFFDDNRTKSGRVLEISKVTTTKVKFKKLTEEQIGSYVDSGEPFDKAGSYGIQGRAKKFVTKIDGSFVNVMGFPLEEFLKQVRKKGWNGHLRKAR